MQLHAGVDAFHDSAADAGRTAAQRRHRHAAATWQHDRDACLDLIMGTLVGPQLGLDRLTFIYDYPASQAALARDARPQSPRASRRIWTASSSPTAFTSLAIAQEQRARFEHDRRGARAPRSAGGADRRALPRSAGARAAGVLGRGARLRSPGDVRRRRAAHRRSARLSVRPGLSHARVLQTSIDATNRSRRCTQSSRRRRERCSKASAT